jgi:hypothetical protein
MLLWPHPRPHYSCPPHRRRGRVHLALCHRQRRLGRPAALGVGGRGGHPRRRGRRARRARRQGAGGAGPGHAHRRPQEPRGGLGGEAAPGSHGVALADSGVGRTLRVAGLCCLSRPTRRPSPLPQGPGRVQAARRRRRERRPRRNGLRQRVMPRGGARLGRGVPLQVGGLGGAGWLLSWLRALLLQSAAGFKLELLPTPPPAPPMPSRAASQPARADARRAAPAALPPPPRRAQLRQHQARRHRLWRQLLAAGHARRRR